MFSNTKNTVCLVKSKWDGLQNYWECWGKNNQGRTLRKVSHQSHNREWTTREPPLPWSGRHPLIWKADIRSVSSLIRTRIRKPLLWPRSCYCCHLLQNHVTMAMIKVDVPVSPLDASDVADWTLMPLLTVLQN